eukprot:g21214.t1
MDGLSKQFCAEEKTLLCFQKFSETTPGFLSSQALLRALAEMNLTPKTFREKRLMKEAWTSGQARRAPGVVLAQVQELVIKLYRKEETAVRRVLENPLTAKKGGWLLEEFMAMTATYKELMRVEQLEALADENGCELAVIIDFRQVYNESKSQDSLVELAALLNVSLGKNMELSRHQKISFDDFIPLMMRVQTMLAQLYGDPVDVEARPCVGFVCLSFQSSLAIALGVPLLGILILIWPVSVLDHNNRTGHRGSREPFFPSLSKNIVTQWTVKILHKVALDIDLTDSEMQDLAALQTVNLVVAGATSRVARMFLMWAFFTNPNLITRARFIAKYRPFIRKRWPNVEWTNKKLDLLSSVFLDAVMFAGGRSVPVSIDLVMGYILTKNKPERWCITTDYEMLCPSKLHVAYLMQVVRFRQVFRRCFSQKLDKLLYPLAARWRSSAAVALSFEVESHCVVKWLVIWLQAAECVSLRYPRNILADWRSFLLQTPRRAWWAGSVPPQRMVVFWSA